MTVVRTLSRELFIACEWRNDVSVENHYGYSSVMQSLQNLAKEKRDTENTEQAEILDLLARAASMMMTPGSLNEPFKPFFQDFQKGRRSAIPEDFTIEELDFFVSILDELNEPWLKSRLADLLWLCKKPKNPDHARLAIDLYLTHPINSKSWRRDVDVCWERAARLAMQINNRDKIKLIKERLFEAFNLEFPDCTFMSLWLATLLDNLHLDSQYREIISSRLLQLGTTLKEHGDFNAARSYLELAARKFKQSGDESGWMDSLVLIAECFEQEADSRLSDSNIVANSFYENAVQAYRKIPIKHRDAYHVDIKIKYLREKINESGSASLNEMGLVKTSGINIAQMAEESIAHVAEKNSFEEALMYFAGLYSGPDYQNLIGSARESIQQSPFGGLFGSSHLSDDGRVIARTPAANLGADENAPENQAILHRQIQQLFELEIQLVVKGQILPALRQILMEHRVTKEFLEAACHHSPIVSQDRTRLLASALWLGFEHDFGNAIHLLCPQFEHIVRVQLKEAGAHTSNIDPQGIENENGLSTLMELPEAKATFGDDLAFEIKSVFTDALGFNLRNEVAHGLLNDNTSSSISSIYAWWMILRLIIHSIMNGGFHAEKEPAEEESNE